MKQLIDKPLGSLVVIDDTICEVVRMPHKFTLLSNCVGCIFDKCVTRCTEPALPFECIADLRSDGEWVIFRPIDVD